MSAPTALSRFQELAQVITTFEQGLGNLTEKGVREAVHDFETAIPTARTIATFGGTLETHTDPIRQYLREVVEAMTPEDFLNDNDPEWQASLKQDRRETAMYFLGLAVGLMLADRV